MTDSRSSLWPQVNTFLQYLRVERQLSAKTQESYQRQLTTLISMASEMGLAEWRQLEVSQVRSLATRSKRKGLKAASLALRLSALRSFLDWLVSIGQLDANAARGVPAPRHGRHLPKNMDVDEVDHLLDIDTHDPLALRDRAMLEVMYGAGLRLAELVGLNCVDVDLRGGELRVVGKGN
ncbi:site-specific tyrosine recombinase XerC, partial [Sodalis-like endosymbiont of Proechinophthirus fluctus]|uniref:site-specific integrase n=1 Tax=Sodalis-like endosymbiont of Proechinophthirus fluctus TaxID=1462730 RepID=UPI0007A8DB12